jgi:hypothetical protein
MEDSDRSVVDVAPSLERPRITDPSLPHEALIKARKFREFVKEAVDDWDRGNEPASSAIVCDYNGLRAIVVESSPNLVAILPPEISNPTPGVGPVRLTYRELLFFCDQIQDFLEHRTKDGQAKARFPEVDAGASLFGPDGLKHDPVILAAARVKAQPFLGLVEGKVTSGLGTWRTPIVVIEEYNHLLALMRQASPELDPFLPREIVIPLEPKPQAEELPSPSIGSSFFSFLKRPPRPKTPKYSELSYYCDQIARLLR